MSQPVAGQVQVPKPQVVSISGVSLVRLGSPDSTMIAQRTEACCWGSLVPARWARSTLGWVGGCLAPAEELGQQAGPHGGEPGGFPGGGHLPEGSRGCKRGSGRGQWATSDQGAPVGGYTGGWKPPTGERDHLKVLFEQPADQSKSSQRSGGSAGSDDRAGEGWIALPKKSRLHKTIRARLPRYFWAPY